MALEFQRSLSEYLSSDSSYAHGIGAGDFTIALWVRRTANTNWFQGIYSNGTFPVIYAYHGTPTTWAANVNAGTWDFDTTLTIGQWTHLVLRRSGTTVTGWVGGVQEATTYSVGSSVSNATQRIGYSGTGSQYADGSLSEWGLWNVALSSEEIAALAAGFTPLRVRLASLQGYLPMRRRNEERDIISGIAWSETGTLANFAHPRIIPPPTPRTVFPVSSAAPTAPVTVSAIGTFAAPYLEGGAAIMSAGTATFTGSSLSIDTDLATLDYVSVTLMATTVGAGEALDLTYNHGADGLLDVYAWDAAGAAATVECTVAWMAHGR